jgi:site-specific recombinase XerD
LPSALRPMRRPPKPRIPAQADLAIFSRWCAARRLAAMPADPTTLLAFLVDHAGKVRISTLQRRLAAIREAHRYNGTELDTSGAAFRDTWRGIRRAHARPPNKRAPMVTAVLRQALANACAPDKLISLRDRALLLIGFAGALRRGELASLEVAYRDGGHGWIETTPEGLAVHLCRSKTNQEGADETIAIPYGTALETCPVRFQR